MLSKQFIRYAVVGALGTGIHLVTLTLWVEWLKSDPISGTVAGFVGALLASYTLNHCWTFRSSRAHHESLWRYIAVSLSGLVLNITMMYVLVYIFNFWYLGAQLAVIFVVPTTNYLLNRHWTFSTKADAG